jgi:peptidoglycan/xylan/chitin deacetylase (PgdA/CDA1 family)
MSGQQLRSLPAHRVEVGSHSVSHCKLTELSDSQVFSELRDSKSVLEDLLGMAVHSFAYPHGRYDARVMELVAAAGYVDAYCTDGQRRFTGPSDRLCVPRKYITYHDGLSDFLHRIGYVNEV